MPNPLVFSPEAFTTITHVFPTDHWQRNRKCVSNLLRVCRFSSFLSSHCKTVLRLWWLDRSKSYMKGLEGDSGILARLDTKDESRSLWNCQGGCSVHWARVRQYDAVVSCRCDIFTVVRITCDCESESQNGWNLDCFQAISANKSNLRWFFLLTGCCIFQCSTTHNNEDSWKQDCTQTFLFCWTYNYWKKAPGKTGNKQTHWTEQFQKKVFLVLSWRWVPRSSQSRFPDCGGPNAQMCYFTPLAPDAQGTIQNGKAMKATMPYLRENDEILINQFNFQLKHDLSLSVLSSVCLLCACPDGTDALILNFLSLKTCREPRLLKGAASCITNTGITVTSSLTLTCRTVIFAFFLALGLSWSLRLSLNIGSISVFLSTVWSPKGTTIEKRTPWGTHVSKTQEKPISTKSVKMEKCSIAMPSVFLQDMSYRSQNRNRCTTCLPSVFHIQQPTKIARSYVFDEKTKELFPERSKKTSNEQRQSIKSCKNAQNWSLNLITDLGKFSPTKMV